MKFYITAIIIFCAGLLNAQTVQSPSKEITVTFAIDASGRPNYTVSYKNKPVILKSGMGLEIKHLPALTGGFKAIETAQSTVDTSWKPVLGEVAEIRNNYNQLAIALEQVETGRRMNIIFRVFDEGVGFRYDFPKQPNLNYFIVSGENTEFNLAGDHKAFWIPGDFDSQEYAYNETLLSQIDNQKVDMNNGIGMKSIPQRYAVQSPLMMKSKDGLYINIFEAAVINYPVMHLQSDPAKHTLKSLLVPNAMGDMAFLQTPAHTPWRTIMVSDDARKILAQKMILNLNDPSAIDDTSWIKPMKYIGIWWEMHAGKSTWDMSGTQDAAQKTTATPRPHGATTANAKKYIDFAKKHGFEGLLIEGWNTGWEDWYNNWKEEVFDFTTPYPDFNVKEVSDYAKKNGVQLIMHHETSGSVSNYERRLDRAFKHMKDYGYQSVKSGYVGRIIPRGEFHDGQTMVNHYLYVVKRAAENKIMVDSHESARPTGVQRTWPNYIAAEAARGNEFNAWSVGNPPTHETILPFTRLLGGPMDYTPGIFEIKMNVYDPTKTEQVHTTLAKQLALYITMYSPLQMAADIPENYEKYPDAFQFIKDVETDWQDTKILEAEPGDYITIARKTKGKESWFLGAITDENTRTTTVSLDFLTPGKKYRAVIYQDGKTADWKNNPISYEIKTQEVTSKTKLKLILAAGGGTAISFMPIDK
ncbi:alpha-glucosidase [Flavobacterium album]|uniref:Alpha-glucosidase n=1 Tax=Flavobacterium album TaxID=2175091 RepID=A0A2S1R1R0_9FLAO|nr:glycoside hydrolase family 97 protein [Flavobacterium album]AWH86519.1 alpha-glucosidase [Flavobacterium album]